MGWIPELRGARSVSAAMAMGLLVPSSSAPYCLSSPVATISEQSSWVPVQLGVRKSRRLFHLCCVQAHTQRTLGFVSSGFWSSGGWDPEQRKLAVAMVKTSAAPIELQASALPEAQAVAPHEEGIKPVKMKIYKLSELNADQVQDLRNRPRIDFSSIFETVNPLPVFHIQAAQLRVYPGSLFLSCYCILG
jgi:hypothetical protein